MLALYDAIATHLARKAPLLLPLLARGVFAGVLLGYFWSSAATKIGPGPLGFLSPSDSAYFQIFPKAVEAAGYDVAKLGAWHWLVTLAGMWAEFLLPALIVAGLFTRLAALGMAGFIAVQTMTDIFGHGLAAADIGGWFDRDSASLIADQRGLWLAVLAVPVFLGGGALSLDRFLRSARSNPAGPGTMRQKP